MNGQDVVGGDALGSKRRKICVVITARASYARVKSVLVALERHGGVELQLVVGASALLDRYGSAVDVIEGDGFKVDAKVFMIVEGENLVTSAKSTGLGLAELATVFDHLKPDVVVSVGDRFETIATAIAGSYMNLPVAHLQGGEVTGSIDEKVRHAVTKLANVHLVATEKARERVVRMGEDERSVYLTGCPSIDLAREVRERPGMDYDPFKKYGGVGKLTRLPREYVVVMQHPVTTEYEAAREQTRATLRAAERFGVGVLWFWPNVDAGSDGTSNAIRSFRERSGCERIHFFKHFGAEDFLRLLVGAQCLVGNSSVGIRECSYLGVGAVNVGTRQSGRDRGGNVVDVDYDEDAIVGAVQEFLDGKVVERNEMYGDGRSGERIAEILATVHLGIEKRLTY